MKEIKRGQIWYADLSPVVGSEQGGLRPCLVIQNDIGNKYSPTTIIAIITSRYTKAKLPTQHWINKGQGGLVCDSMVECEQIRTIDKTRLKEFMGTIGEKDQEEINKKIKISLAVWGKCGFPKFSKFGKKWKTAFFSPAATDNPVSAPNFSTLKH